MLTLEEFRATGKPCSDALAAALVELGHVGLKREQVSEYADGCMMHEADGMFWVHAWWYPPIGYATKEEAEAELYAWYCEFV